MTRDNQANGTQVTSYSYDAASRLVQEASTFTGNTTSQLHYHARGGQALPYLCGKVDTFCSRSPRYCAVVELPVSQLKGKLASAGPVSATSSSWTSPTAPRAAA